MTNHMTEQEEQTSLMSETTADVRQNVLKRLSDSITQGVFRPGDRLIERELCERFGVSRTSIREALRQLEAEQLIRIVPHRGPVVHLLSVEELLELWEIRTAIERVAARRFALTATPEAVAKLQRTVDRLGEALRLRDVSEIRARKNDFFDCFAHGVGNQSLPRIIHQINARLAFFWTSSLMLPGRPAESIHELTLLVQAISDGKPDVAEAVLIIYNDHARNAALAGLNAFYASRAA